MDLETEAYRAILNLKNYHDKIELETWKKLLTYASPEMEAFEIILSKVDELLENIKLRDQELKQI